MVLEDMISPVSRESLRASLESNIKAFMKNNNTAARMIYLVKLDDEIAHEMIRLMQIVDRCGCLPESEWLRGPTQ